MVVDAARTALHQLVDALPEEGMGEAERYLRCLGSGETDSVRWSLGNAPAEDEPISQGENAGFEEAWREYRDRETISSGEAKLSILA